MAKIKKLKVKQEDGSYGTDVSIGADATNIDFTDGKNLEEKVTEINNTIDTKITDALESDY